jgi:hypothetical protein
MSFDAAQVRLYHVVRHRKGRRAPGPGGLRACDDHAA